jgi:hypothetical protein
VKARNLVRTRARGACCQDVIVALEGEIAGQEKAYEIIRRTVSAAISNACRQRRQLVVRELEFGGGPRNIPCNVLAPDQVVRLAVVQCIGLQKCAIGQLEPFPGLQPIVSGNAQNLRFQTRCRFDPFAA